jgi:hypothetical protein
MSDIVERLRQTMPPSSYVREHGYGGAMVRMTEDELRPVIDALTAQVSALTAEVAELLDMNSDRSEIEQERDEARNSMRFYAAETKRLTTEVAALTRKAVEP